MARPLLEGMTPSRSLLADKGYDAAELRRFLTERGTEAVIPNKRNRTRERFAFDAVAYRQRNLVERMFAVLKDFRRIATRYDKLAQNFAAAIQLCAAVIWWSN